MKRDLLKKEERVESVALESEELSEVMGGLKGHCGTIQCDCGNGDSYRDVPGDYKKAQVESYEQWDKTDF